MGLLQSLQLDEKVDRRLIGRLTFVRRRRKVNHYVMLTRHSIFNYYRYRIGKESHTSCWDCGE